MAEQIKLRLHFSFPAALSLLLCTDREGTAVLCLLACLLHELGHIIVLFGEGNIPRAIDLCAGGIRIDSGNSRSIPALLGGCLSNLFLFCLFWISGGENQLFAVINLLTAMLNFLPIRPLDGGLLLERLLLFHVRADKLDVIMRTIEAVVGAAAVLTGAVLFLNGAVSASAGLLPIYLLGLEIIEKKPPRR